MGQKVNPHGLRVGVIQDWDSRWFANKAAFGDTLVRTTTFVISSRRASRTQVFLRLRSKDMPIR